MISPIALHRSNHSTPTQPAAAVAPSRAALPNSLTRRTPTRAITRRRRIPVVHAAAAQSSHQASSNVRLLSVVCMLRAGHSSHLLPQNYMPHPLTMRPCSAGGKHGGICAVGRCCCGGIPPVPDRAVCQARNLISVARSLHRDFANTIVACDSSFLTRSHSPSAAQPRRIPHS